MDIFEDNQIATLNWINRLLIVEFISFTLCIILLCFKFSKLNATLNMLAITFTIIYLQKIKEKQEQDLIINRKKILTLLILLIIKTILIFIKSGTIWFGMSIIFKFAIRVKPFETSFKVLLIGLMPILMISKDFFCFKIFRNTKN